VFFAACTCFEILAHLQNLYNMLAFVVLSLAPANIPLKILLRILTHTTKGDKAIKHLLFRIIVTWDKQILVNKILKTRIVKQNGCQKNVELVALGVLAGSSRKNVRKLCFRSFSIAASFPHVSHL